MVFYKVADNVYKIKSKCNGLYLDVYGKGSNNGTNVDVYADNNSEAQMFYLEQVQIYPEGEYEIEAKLKSDMILDVNGGSKANAANIQMWESSNVEQQKFILSYTKSDNTYTIKAKHSNKVITTNNNGSVYQYDYTGEDGQKWYIKRSRKWLLLYKFKITRININNSKHKLSKWNNNKNRKFKWKRHTKNLNFSKE